MKFLEGHKQLKLMQKETEQLDSGLMTSEEIE